MLVTLHEILSEIKNETSAIAAFNVFDYEDAQAVVQAAEDTKKPVILMANKPAVQHIPVEILGPLLKKIAERSSAKVCVHLDHCTEYEIIVRAMMSGFTSVMFDGSQLPYEDNANATKQVVKTAHACGVSVEAEIGAVGYADGTVYNSAYTSPEQALQFERDTEADCIAVAVGTVHRMTEQTARLDYALLDSIYQKLSVPIVIHGATGVPDEDLQRLVRHQAKKINIGTCLRMAFGNTLRKGFEENPRVFDRISLYPAAAQAVYEAAKSKIKLLNP